MIRAIETRRYRRFGIMTLCIAIAGLLIASSSHASHRQLVLNFNRDIQTSGFTGTVINGVNFSANLPINTTDDLARDKIASLIDAHASFGTVSVGDTTLWVFASGSGINTVTTIGNQGTVVSARIVGADVLMIDVDPKDSSTDVEAVTTTLGSSAGGVMTINIAGTNYGYDPSQFDSDAGAAAQLFFAGIGALPGAVRVGATTIVLPHCASDIASSSSLDPNLGVTVVEMDIHIPCLNPPGSTEVGMVSGPGQFTPAPILFAVSYDINFPVEKGQLNRISLVNGEVIQNNLLNPMVPLPFGIAFEITEPGDGIVYVVGKDSLWEVTNTTTGAVTKIGDHNIGSFFEGDAAFDNVGLKLYAVDVDLIYVVNTLSGAAGSPNTITGLPISPANANVDAIAFDAAGDLWLIESSIASSSQPAFLMKVNKTTFAVESASIVMLSIGVQTLGVVGGTGGMSFHPTTGELWFADGFVGIGAQGEPSRVFTIDTANGTMTAVGDGDAGITSGVSGLTFFPQVLKPFPSPLVLRRGLSPLALWGLMSLGLLVLASAIWVGLSGGHFHISTKRSADQ